MNAPEDDDLSFNNDDNDEFQEKLDFEENDLILEESIKDVSLSKYDSQEEGIIKDKSLEIKKDRSKIINLRCVKVSEDGELNEEEDSDNDLEEGELKEDDDPINQSLDCLINKKDDKKKIPCKFYSNGFCTWGDNCRFGHENPANTNNFNKPLTNRINPQQNYFPKQYNKYNNEFDIRTNLDSRLDYDDQDSRREMYSSRDKGFYSNQNLDKDYERKRRLAFESAPWNNQNNLDQRRDYRKSNYSQMESNLNNDYKSPKKDHSSSSSFTVADFSSSDSEKSFKQQSTKNLNEKKRKYSADNLDNQSPQLPTNYQSHHHSSSKRDKYDDANSTSSSFFTDSGSLEKEDNQDKINQSTYNRSRSPSRLNKSSESREQQYHQSKESAKTMDLQTRSLKSYSKKSHYQTSSTSRRRSIEKDEEKKQPIKMTFMRKQSSLKKGVKLNGSRDEFGNEEDFDLYGSKEDVISKRLDINHSREELLKRLKEIDEAIAKKRSKQA